VTAARPRSFVPLSLLSLLMTATAACAAPGTPHGDATPSRTAISTSTMPPSFSTVAGSYVAGTADGGALYIRADGKSRFSGPDLVACPTCSTANAPIGTVDFSVTMLRATAAGAYAASGRITAESDPAWAAQLLSGPARAIPVGTPMSLAVAGHAVTLSFLPPSDVLRR